MISVHGEEHEAAASIEVSLAHCSTEIKDNSKALDHLSRALKLLELTGGKKTSGIAMVHAQVGKVYLNLSEKDKAQAQLKIAISTHSDPPLFTIAAMMDETGAERLQDMLEIYGDYSFLQQEASDYTGLVETLFQVHR